MESIKLKSKAVQKESTTNPPTILVHKTITKPLMINRNNPKVTMVNGKVSTTIMGLIKILMSPKTNATINEVTKLSKCTPDIKFESSNTKPAVIKSRNSIFIFLYFN